MSRPSSITQNLSRIPPRANITWPSRTRVAKMMVPNCIPNTLRKMCCEIKDEYDNNILILTYPIKIHQ